MVPNVHLGRQGITADIVKLKCCLPDTHASACMPQCPYQLLHPTYHSTHLRPSP
jgi:hypothetical protein